MENNYMPPEGYLLDSNTGLYYTQVIAQDELGNQSQVVTWFNPETGEYSQNVYPIAKPLKEVKEPQKVAPQRVAPQRVAPPQKAVSPKTVKTQTSSGNKKVLIPILSVVALAIFGVGFFFGIKLLNNKETVPSPNSGSAFNEALAEYKNSGSSMTSNAPTSSNTVVDTSSTALKGVLPADAYFEYTVYPEDLYVCAGVSPEDSSLCTAISLCNLPLLPDASPATFGYPVGTTTYYYELNFGDWGVVAFYSVEEGDDISTAINSLNLKARYVYYDANGNQTVSNDPVRFAYNDDIITFCDLKTPSGCTPIGDYLNSNQVYVTLWVGNYAEVDAYPIYSEVDYY